MIVRDFRGFPVFPAHDRINNPLLEENMVDFCHLAERATRAVFEPLVRRFGEVIVASLKQITNIDNACGILTRHFGDAGNMAADLKRRAFLLLQDGSDFAHSIGHRTHLRTG